MFRDPHEIKEHNMLYSQIKEATNEEGVVINSSPEKKLKKNKLPDYKKLLFDYDTSRQNVIPQISYIGSQYANDYLN